MCSQTTTGDTTTLLHGLCPKLSGEVTEYLDGTGDFSVPSHPPVSGSELTGSILAPGLIGIASDQACSGNDTRLSDARSPVSHAASHKTGGSDPLKLNELTTPTASVDFGNQEALGFRLENRVTDPLTPSVGQIWLRTDL
jgi:hypothetical protein